MTGILDIDTLLASMKPVLKEGEYVFSTVTGSLSDYAALEPLASFVEDEGLTLVLTKEAAESANITFENSYRQITLSVHSSLEAVGLTAAVSNQLTSYGISANVIAAYYHDHVFIQTDKADLALSALQTLSKDNQ